MPSQFPSDIPSSSANPSKTPSLSPSVSPSMSPNFRPWIQIGQDIDGEAAGDGSGIVSLSANGNFVAIGADHNDGNGDRSGHVRVYQLVGSSWTKVGQDIDGEAAVDFSGRHGSVSLSADGDVVAIGAYFNDGGGTRSGHVRVYQLVGSSWTKVGQDLDGEAAENRFGHSVSLSADGRVVAIGAVYHDGNFANVFGSGQVRVFELVGSSWIQVGEDLNAEAAGDNC